MKRVVRLLRVILSVGKVEFWVCMGAMVVVGGVLAGGLGLGDTVEVLVSVLIGLLHLCRWLHLCRFNNLQILLLPGNEIR